MKSKTSIQMEDFGLKELRVEWFNPLGEGEPSARKLDVGYEIRDASTPRMVQIDMTFSEAATTLSDEKLYSVFIRVLGFFRLDESLPLEERAKLIYSNGLAMLFSSLRGVLLPVSGCFPPGFRYILPTVNLQDVIREVEAKRKTQAEAAKPPQVREPEPVLSPAKRTDATAKKRAAKKR